MNERDLAVLEQYDLTVSEAWRGRGSYICVTDAGKKILQTYRASEGRARTQAALLEKLRGGGIADVDMPVPNREGCFVSQNRFGTGYLLKDYVEGRACDVGCRDELLEAAANLARIHSLMRMPDKGIPVGKAPDKDAPDTDVLNIDARGTDAQGKGMPDTGAPDKDAPDTDVLNIDARGTDAQGKGMPDTGALDRNTPGTDAQGADTPDGRKPHVRRAQRIAESVRRRNREMKKIRAFIRGKQNKTQFELYVLQYFPMFYEKGIRVQEALADAAFSDMEEAAEREGCWRHGEYTQHNVLFTKNGVATVNFEHCAPGLQLEDLALFLRKMMEKYDWDEALGQRLLRQYGRERPLDANAVRYLGLRLSYPEKFWKLLNRYYNLGKAWISDRSCTRLVRLAAQEPRRDAFVRRLL